MINKRRQGRPKRGQNEVGSDFIISNARDALRRKVFDVFSRKDLAAAVGVTPALINYYFPRGVNVAELVLRPVISLHLQTLIEVIEANLPPEKKLCLVIHNLIKAFSEDKNIFDAYESEIRAFNVTPKDNLIERMRFALVGLMRECHEAGLYNPFALPVQHGAIWGMCRAAADIERQGPFNGTTGPRRIDEARYYYSGDRAARRRGRASSISAPNIDRSTGSHLAPTGPGQAVAL